MKHYDFKKAKELIAKNITDLESASLGMHEDWGWTSETIWRDGKYTESFDKGADEIDFEIAGINGSSWATPTLELIFKNGEPFVRSTYLMYTDRAALLPQVKAFIDIVKEYNSKGV